MNLEEWREKYRPIENPREGLFYGDYGFDTHGNDWQVVSAADPSKVWTIVEDEDGRWSVESGLHVVNRMGYFITEVPHDFNTSVAFDDDDDFDEEQELDDEFASDDLSP